MVINFCGGVSKGSGDIIIYVVVCSGILCELLQYGDFTSLITTPNKVISSLSWTVKISDYSALAIQRLLFDAIINQAFQQVAYNSKPY